MPLPDQYTIVRGHLLSQILHRLSVLSKLLKNIIKSVLKLKSGGGYAQI